MSLSGTVAIDFNIADKRTVGLAQNVTANPRLPITITYADGVLGGQANKEYSATRTIPGGGNDDIDLAGVLTDAFGGTITLARLKALVVYNPAGNGDLSVGGGTNPETTLITGTGVLKIKPNGCIAIATDDLTSYAITAGTADILRVAGTAGQSYSIALVGADA